MDIVFETRFSYFGNSGWRSPASTDPGLLFEPERLENRLTLFHDITLASLKAQSDPDFRHLIISSKQLPAEYKKKLVEMCHDVLGEERSEVIFRPYGSCARMVRQWIRTEYPPQQPVAQVVLDDDDAVSVDFVEVLKREVANNDAQIYDAEPMYFISFPRGVSMVLNEKRQFEGLFDRMVPCTNLGLTMVAPAEHRKNPFGIAHRKIAQRHATRIIHTKRPFYIRTVHGMNDSNAMVGDEPVSGEALDQVLELFPCLHNFAPTPAMIA